MDLLQVKWKSFVKKEFFTKMFLYTVFFCLASFCFITRNLSTQCGEEGFNNSTDNLTFTLQLQGLETNDGDGDGEEGEEDIEVRGSMKEKMLRLEGQRRRRY